MTLAAAAFAIDAYAIPVVRIRRAPGSYVDGIWVNGSEATSEIMAAIFAMSPHTLRDLPEGIREDAEWTAWSRSSLLPVDETTAREPDRLSWQGGVWRVIHSWPRVEGGFYKAALGRVEAAR